MSLQNFGKKVRLEVFDSPDYVTPIFVSGSLRVDFHIKHMQSWNRAKVSIYNLDNDVIKEISTGDRYLRIYTQLHDEPERFLVGNLYVSNAITRKAYTDAVTELFCISTGEKDLTAKEIKLKVYNTSIEGTIRKLITAAGADRKIELVGFPEQMRKYIPLKPTLLNANAMDELERLGKMYNFSHYHDEKVIRIVYDPNHRNLHLCEWDKRGIIQLSNEDMRANAVIGVATANISSNLDARIKTGVLLDTAALVTADSEYGLETLAHTKGFLSASVSGFSIFNTLSVEHIGSTHTKKWDTKAMAIKTNTGSNLNSYNWQGR